MAVWRTKACELFGFERDAYSHAHGVVALFDNLHHMARRASNVGDRQLLDRIFQYATWADAQTAENLRSAADIMFFGPILRDPQLASEAKARLPEALLSAKSHLLGAAG